MDKKFNYVYVTTCLINDKKYVGSHCTDNIDDSYIGSGRLFLKAVRKYGKENFRREIIEECENSIAAREKEGPLIEELNTLDPYGYNLSPKGGIGFKGANHSESTKKKMSVWQKGKTYEELYGAEKAAEMKKKQREKKLGKSTSRKGKGHKQEMIEKYGEEEGVKRYENFVEKMRNSHLGGKGFVGPHSIETRKKISDAISGEKHPNWGIKFSKERRENLKKPHKTKQKMMMQNPEIIKKVKELRELGYTLKQISEETGLHYYNLKLIK